MNLGQLFGVCNSTEKTTDLCETLDLREIISEKLGNRLRDVSVIRYDRRSVNINLMET